MIPSLLDKLRLKGSLVTIDAAGSYRPIAERIVEAGADYLLTVKANQPKLLAGIKAALERAAPETVQSCERAETSHGRQEHRRCTVAPAPAGAAASRLDAIEVLAAGSGAVIRIAGDGEFPYSTFVLNDPQRFVIDLDGVINRAPRSALAVTDSVVERVRVAQFRPAPKPVSRVVFDLRRDTVPVIERTSDALVVSFPTAAKPR